MQASIGLASQAFHELDGAYPERAVLLALEALERYPFTPQAEYTLAHAVQQVYPYRDFTPVVGENPDADFYSPLFSPDDQQIIYYYETGYEEWEEPTSGIVALDMASGETTLAFPLGSYCGPDAALALAPDGKRLVVAHQNAPPCPFAVWDIESGKKIITLSDQPETAALDAAWSPDGRFILTGSLDGVARVWDAASGRVIQQLSGHTGPVRAVGWSPDSEHLATGGEDGTVRMWDALTGAPIFIFGDWMGPILSLEWSPSGELLASGGINEEVQVWEATTGLERLFLGGHTDQVSDVAWSAAGDRLATASRDGATRIWNSLTGEQLIQWSSKAWAPRLDWSSQGYRLVSGTRLSDLSPRTVRLVGHNGEGRDAQWSPDGQRIATTTSGGAQVASIWGWPGGQLLNTVELPGGGQYLAWSPDGRRLAIATRFDAFSIWDTNTWQRLWELPGSANESLYSPGWSTDGEYLAISGELDSDIRVLDAASGQVLTRIDSDQPTEIHLRNQSWAPQVDRFITGCSLSGSGDATACVWDAANGKVLLELPEQDSYIVASAYSPDGRYIATVSLTGILQMWEAGSGQPVFPQVNLSGSVTDMHWSPNGKRIAFGVDGLTDSVGDRPGCHDGRSNLQIPAKPGSG